MTSSTLFSPQFNDCVLIGFAPEQIAPVPGLIADGFFDRKWDFRRKVSVAVESLYPGSPANCRAKTVWYQSDLYS